MYKRQSKHLSPDAELWCFSFVTLFNLQGTRPVRSAAERLLSYHTLLNLSSTFFNFFRNLFSRSLRPFFMLSKKLLHYTRFAFACQVLFRFLSKSFPLSAVVLPYRQTAQLVYQTLPDLSSLFFDPFKSFFRRPLPHSRAVRQLV